MKHYVCGFLFNKSLTRVALIKKKRPDWQKGYYNGIGGQIEKDKEDSITAMVREFEEETGLHIWNWWEFLVLRGYKCRIYFFHSTVSDKTLDRAKTKEDEQVKVFNVNKLPKNKIPNLEWLIPLAIQTQVGGLQKGVLIQTPIKISETY